MSNTDSKQEAPERIWIQPQYFNRVMPDGIYHKEPGPRTVEYVRADLVSRASVAAPGGDARCEVSYAGQHRIDAPYCKDCGQVFTPPAAASSPAGPVQPTPEQIVYNVAQRDPRFRKHLIEQLTALGDEQDTGPLRTLAVFDAGFAATTSLPSETAVGGDRCVKCGHRATIDGVCQIGTGASHPVTGYKAVCGCKCVFTPVPDAGDDEEDCMKSQRTSIHRQDCGMPSCFICYGSKR